MGEAQLIIGHVLGRSRSGIIGNKDQELSMAQLKRCRSLSKRRSACEPIAYITGEKEFWSLPFIVSRETLIPRPDSETLVSAVLDQAEKTKTPKRLLDIGTGTGCLLAALLSEWPAATGIGIDISEGAVDTARQNLGMLNLLERGIIVAAEWPFYQTQEKFDLVIANPPYIPSAVIASLDRDVRDYEPLLALDGGPDGLKIHRAIARHAQSVLGAGGLIAVEFGAGQTNDIQQIYEAAGFKHTQVHADLSGTDRCLLATVPN